MNRHNATVVLCILLFYAFNLTRLNSRPATVDDLDTIKHLYSNTFNKSYDLLQTVESVSILSPEHAPAYYVTLNVWRTLVGEDMFVARLLSVFLGLATICVVYRLGLLTGSFKVAVSAPLIFAFLAYFQYYSQIARVYPLLLLIGGCLLWSYWGTVAGKRVSRWRWMLLYASAASALYVHYFSAILLAAVAVYHVIYVPKCSRWFKVAAVLAAGCISFAFWLPVFLRGYNQSHTALADSVLSFSNAFLALLRIYSNGLWLLPLLAAAVLFVYRRRVNSAETYLIVVTAVVLASLLLLNEITPILTERRMRYSLILAAPLCCTLAIALSRLSTARPINLAGFAIWIAASAYFTASHDLALYTNQLMRSRLSIPHYQDFVYESRRLPGHNEPILSFHHSAPVSRFAFLSYYRLILSDWSDIVHLSLDENREPVVESGLSTYSSLDSIEENSRGIWITHNPEVTSLSDMGSFADWLQQHFQPCNRFLDKQNNIIDFYLRLNIPCDLITTDQPFAIRYHNGMALANAVFELNSDSLMIYLRWLRTVDRIYAFSLQLFDDEDVKVRQLDRVISGDPIDIATIDLADLSAGNYVLRLIVYDRESMASQPGESLRNSLQFDRAVDLFNVAIRE